MRFDVGYFVKGRMDLILLLAIVMLGASVRLVSVPTLVADYDPWWYFRHAQDVLTYGLNLPKWDISSYAPPGRPYIHFMGAEYVIVALYKAFSLFFRNMTFMQFFILSPALISGISAIPAYLAGRLMSNKVSGLFTAAFAVLAPTFISYSVAGYLDSKAFVVLYSFLIIYLMMLALKKQKIHYYILAILANVLFVYTWQGGGWYPLIAFMFFLPAVFVFRILENIVHKRQLSIDKHVVISEIKKLIIPYLIILISVNAITQLAGLKNIIQDGILSALYYTGLSQPLLVNISVAELQTLGIFKLFTPDIVLYQIALAILIVPVIFIILHSSKRKYPMLENVFLLFITLYVVDALIAFAPQLQNIRQFQNLTFLNSPQLQNLTPFNSKGLEAVSNQVGLLSTFSTLLGLPIFVVLKLIKKEHVRFEEIFLFLFALITFYMILNGIRFALIFSVAAALSAGYVIGNLFDYIKHKEPILVATAFGLAIIFTLVLISNAYQVATAVSNGYGQDPQWIAAFDWLKANSDNSTVIATWWDPGHIIAGYTGIRPVADGAHCPDTECVTGGINMRIQDMAYVLSSDNETAAVSLLKKYMQLTPDQCSKLKATYGDMIYDNTLHADPCAPMTKMYFIASNDLIGKYYWPRYFSSCIRKFGVQNANSCYSISNDWFKKNAQGDNYLQLTLSSRDNSGNLLYGGGAITLAQKDNQIVPVLNIPNQGIVNAVIQNIVVYNNNQMLRFSYSNVTNVVPGTLFVDPSYQAVIYMSPEISQSLFTRMFFYNGQGLQKFKPVYSNSIIRIYEVEF